MNKITMRSFGHMGRFGNQIFEYAFLYFYARRNNCELQLPPWVGDELFDLENPPIDCELPRWVEPEGPAGDQPVVPKDGELVNKDFYGWAQHHTRYLHPYMQQFQDLFSPTNDIAERLEPASRQMDIDETWVGVHLRRGDYGRSIFPITPVDWYLDFLEKLWPHLPRPRMFIASEDLSLVPEFDDFDPVTAEDLGVKLQTQPHANYNYEEFDLEHAVPLQLDFYPDFRLLSECDIILAPNSTFSFAAAMLSPIVDLYRSNILTQKFERTDPWDAYPLLRDKVEDHPEIPGIRCETNEYW